MATAANGGAKVEVWHGGAAVDRGAPYPFPVVRIPIRGSLDWPCLWGTGSFLRRRREIVTESTLCLPEPGPIFAYLYAGALRLPWPRRLVLVLHGSEILRLAAFPHRRLGFRRFLGCAAVIGVVSEYTRGLLNRHFPGHLDRVVVVPGALRSDFQGLPARKRPADDGETRILTVARLHPRKGIHHTLAALGRLPRDLRRKVLYQAVGPETRSRYTRDLKRLAKDVDVRFEILGDVQDHRRFYAEADIFAMTSESIGLSVEGFGLVYLEAGAFGLPVVAHDSGGVGEAVWQEKTGLLVRPGNESGLTHCFERLLTDEVLRRRMGEAGRARTKALSWGGNVEKLFAVDLAGGKNAGVGR